MPGHDVAFYIPTGEIIPTRLRLMVDDRQISYERVPDKFGFDFHYCCGETQDEAIAITKHLASIMCDQSYDHGQEWRIIAIELVDQAERYKIGETVRVLFRVRDSY